MNRQRRWMTRTIVGASVPVVAGASGDAGELGQVDRLHAARMCSGCAAHRAPLRRGLACTRETTTGLITQPSSFIVICRSRVAGNVATVDDEDRPGDERRAV